MNQARCNLELDFFQNFNLLNVSSAKFSCVLLKNYKFSSYVNFLVR